MSFKFGAKSQKQEDFFRKAFDKVKDAIEAMITSGDPLTWEKAWCNPRKPKNFTTGKDYSGSVNAAFLEIICQINGYTSSIWAGAGQIRDKGGKVREGEEGWPIFVPRFKSYEKEDPATGKKEKKQKFIGWSIYSVYNADQQDGIDVSSIVPSADWSIEGEVSDFVCKHMDHVEFRYSGRAFYSLSADMVYLPMRNQFTSQEGFLSTLFHEMSHWSGHPDRLHRFEIGENASSFGSEEYSFEELVAELGSAMLKARYGVDDGNANAAAYIKSWWSHLSCDISELTKAYGKAQIAVDYLV